MRVVILQRDVILNHRLPLLVNSFQSQLENSDRGIFGTIIVYFLVVRILKFLDCIYELHDEPTVRNNQNILCIILCIIFLLLCQVFWKNLSQNKVNCPFVHIFPPLAFWCAKVSHR